MEKSILAIMKSHHLATTPTFAQNAWQTLFIVCGLLLIMGLHGALAFHGAMVHTPTVDEVAHVPAGLSYVQKYRFRMYPHNPPLARILYGMATSGLHLPVQYQGTWTRHEPPNHWQFAFELLAASSTTVEDQARYLTAFTRARAVVVLWSLVTMPILFYWARWWFGNHAGWLAVSLWAVAPNIIAHAGLATTDAPATCTIVIACYAFAVWLERATWLRAAAVGILLGLALLTKFSTLWLVFLWPVWAWLVWWHQQKESDNSYTNATTNVVNTSRLSWLRPLAHGVVWRQFFAMVFIAVTCINLGYLGEGTFTRCGEFPFVSNSLTRPRRRDDPPPRLGSNASYNRVLSVRVNRFVGTIFARVPCPLPYRFVTGFDEQKFEAEGKYQMYLRGEWRQSAGYSDTGRTGWWYYYFYALAIKEPLGTWALLFLATIAIFRWRTPKDRWDRILPLWGLALAPVLAMTFLSDINLGLRYVLPGLPFFYLLASSAARPGAPRWWYVLLLTLLAWNIMAVVKIHPHELAYFNEWVGPRQGRFHLADSNIDWGQDLRLLARWLERHPEWRGARIAYWGTVPPEMEGISAWRLPQRQLSTEFALARPLPGEPDVEEFPAPGKYIVSVNFERGMKFHMPCPWNIRQAVAIERREVLLPLAHGQLLEIPARAFTWFQEFEPIIEPEIGYSLLLYDITPSMAAAARARILKTTQPLHSPPSTTIISPQQSELQ